MSNVDKLLENMGKMMARKAERDNSPAVKAYEKLIADTQEKYPIGTTIQDDHFIKEWDGATATIAAKGNPQMITFATVNNIEDFVSGEQRISKNY